MKHLCSILLVFTAATLGQSNALTVGQVDTFEDGTTQGWTVGSGSHPIPPINISSSGPAGADDNYLLVRSIAALAGSGSRLSVFNLDQWAGDYLATGVGAISMDVSNFGPDDLYLRLLFADPIAGPPSNIAFSADPVFVPAGSGWSHVVFPVEASDLLAALGSVNGALGGATELRLYHSLADVAVSPVSPVLPVTAELGVDNIQALAGNSRVPDGGSTAWLLAIPASLLALARFRPGQAGNVAAH